MSVSGVSSAVKLLYVDMDGTVLKTDSLWESLLVLLRSRPLDLLRLPFWMAKGKAYFKRQVAERVSLDPGTLPYRQDVVTYLAKEKGSGKELVLATASDSAVAHSIAEHLGLFSAVLASDGKTNLSGLEKLHAVQRHAGANAFDYVGDSAVDLPIWKSARHAIVVSPSPRLLQNVSAATPVGKVFAEQRSKLSDVVAALRVHQWAKNVLLFVPLIVGHKVTDVVMLTNLMWGFLAFSFCASGVYVVNDLIDLEADRHHPQKKHRPFASGALSIPFGLLMVPVLFALGLSTAMLQLSPLFVAQLGFYLLVTFAYSLWIKRIVILDVLTLAGLYTVRVLAGGEATGIPISPWLLAFSTFLFLSLAFMKRYAELRMVQERSGAEIRGRGYTVSDIALLGNVGPSSGLLCILVLALYVHSDAVALLYSRPLALWLTGPCLLYWIIRLWLLAHRGLIDNDPIVFTAKDPVSYIVWAVIMVVIAGASIL